MRLVQALACLVAFAFPTRAINSTHSLCGEQLTRHTGFLNDIYYVLFDSTSSAPADSIPLVLWLSGGPGCSGLVGALFELGPCTFDDEQNVMVQNRFSWTTYAHVVFVDQPRGTGFSLAYESPKRWTEKRAMKDLADFVDAFFESYPSLQTNDFFIFGESYGGHFAPDLGTTLLKRNPNWRTRIKGVGIGNGMVSPIANLQTYLAFAKGNKYASDIISGVESELRERVEPAINLSLRCRTALGALKVGASKKKRMRALALDNERSTDDYPPVCHQAAGATTDFEMTALSSVVRQGYNMYDLRRRCNLSDRLGLCYWLSRLEDYVNEYALEYFGVPDRTWSLCSSDVMATLPAVEYLEESEENVASLLENGVRVLVYAGDADTMCHWNMQEQWTQDLQWSGQNVFNQSPLNKLDFDGAEVGQVRSAKGLSLVRVYDAGHMVPRDQPSVALELLRRFTQVPSTFS